MGNRAFFWGNTSKGAGQSQRPLGSPATRQMASASPRPFYWLHYTCFSINFWLLSVNFLAKYILQVQGVHILIAVCKTSKLCLFLMALMKICCNKYPPQEPNILQLVRTFWLFSVKFVATYILPQDPNMLQLVCTFWLLSVKFGATYIFPQEAKKIELAHTF